MKISNKEQRHTHQIKCFECDNLLGNRLSLEVHINWEHRK